MTREMPADGADRCAQASAPDWDSYLRRLRCAAAAIGRDDDFVHDDALTYPDILPEYQPEYLGSVIGEAISAVRSAAESRWELWRDPVRKLIATVLPWPEGDRVRAIALAVVRHTLGLRLGHDAEDYKDILVERSVDLAAFHGEDFAQDGLAIVQVRRGDRLAGIGFLPGVGPRESRAPLAEALSCQAGDFPLRDSVRSLGMTPQFWMTALAHLIRSAKEGQRRVTPWRATLQSALKGAVQSTVHSRLAAEFTGRDRDAGPALARASTAVMPILMYHRVSDHGDPALSRFRVTPARFREQMEALARAGFTPISLGTMRAIAEGRAPMPLRPILISFDDGYSDFYDNAWPILRGLSFPSTMFVVAGKVGDCSDWDLHLGRPEPLMNWTQLAEIAAGGVSIGSHSVTHRRFSRLSIQEAFKEMQESAVTIGKNLGQRPDAFCYPYGVFDRSVERILPICGYEFGFTCEPRIASLSENPLRLPRIEVLGTDDADSLMLKIGDHAARVHS